MAFGRCGLYVAVAFFGAFAFAQDYKPGEVIVKLKSNKGSMSSYAFMGKAQSEKEMTLKASYGKMNLHHFSLGKGQSVEQAIYDLSQDPDVEYVEPNYILTKTGETGFHEAFSLEEIQAYSAQSKEVLITDIDVGLSEVWESASASSNGFSAQSTVPVVAVIDSGLQMNHPVFVNSNAIWVNSDEIPGNGIDDDQNGYIDDVNGWNFVHGSKTIIDDDGHGTHVSGIVLGVGQNIFANPIAQANIKIMPLKTLDGDGKGTTSAAIQAIYYAVNNGATVLNNSWGGYSYSAALHDAIAFSYSRGVAFVAAAGNDTNNNDSKPLFPASYDVPNVISVGATTSSNYLASFSNYGPGSVHLAAPGNRINSTYPPSATALSSGTSMAAPFVSGTIARMKIEAPTMMGYQLKQIVLDNVQYLSQLTGRVISGGMLNSSLAISRAGTATVEPSQPSYKVTYLGGRGLASEQMAGCGTVGKLGAGGAGGVPFSQIFVTISLLLMPLLVYQARRLIQPKSRRRHERYKIDSEVRISVGDKELVGSVSSISLGGAQVNTAALLEDGGLVTMLIESPDGTERIEVAGRVVWSEANKSYGVAFDQAPQSVLHRITDWTRGLQKG